MDQSSTDLWGTYIIGSQLQTEPSKEGFIFVLKKKKFYNSLHDIDLNDRIILVKGRIIK